MPHDPLAATSPQPAQDDANEPAAAQSAAGPSASTGLLDLPDELLLGIAGKMDNARDRMRFSQTNRRLRNVMHDSPEKKAAENQYAQDLFLELASARRVRPLPELCRQVCAYLTRPNPATADRHDLIAGRLVEKAGSGEPPWWMVQSSADLNMMIVHFSRIHRSLQRTGVGQPESLDSIDLLVCEFGRLVDARGDAVEPEPWPGKAAYARLLESDSDSDA